MEFEIEDVSIGDDAIIKTYQVRSDTGPIYVFHHGAGHSGLTWSLTCKHLVVHQPCSILCFDARGHGGSVCKSLELSLEQLSLDMGLLVNTVYPANSRDIFLVGHSLGGSVVVETISKALIKNVRGVVVLDVVEGTAIDALPFMKQFLRNRPSVFQSSDDAIKWALQNNQIGSLDSAKISVPSQLAFDPVRKVFTWITDLAATERHWQGWFEGLSDKFISVKAGRLLILAGTDRLDKPLMIGQMQGKFQVIIYPDSGHTIQEDVPDKLADALHTFWERNQSITNIKRFPIPLKPSLQQQKI